MILLTISFFSLILLIKQQISTSKELQMLASQLVLSFSSTYLDILVQHYRTILVKKRIARDWSDRVGMCHMEHVQTIGKGLSDNY